MKFLILSRSICLFILLSLATFTLAEYTDEELKSLAKFKDVIDKNLLDQDFMKSDEFLITWLRARRMNTRDAKEMLTNSIRWRKENHIDSILDEPDTSKCETLYPIRTDSVDKLGRPLMQLNIADWDVRKIMLAGRSDQFVRCVLRLLELMATKTRKQNQLIGSKNITQWSPVLDLKAYNLRLHACVACIPAYINAVRQFEANYPQALANFYIVNAPAFFEALLQIAKSAMSQTTRDAIKVFGFEQSKWQAALLNDIPSDQLTSYYGGTKKGGNRGP